MKRPIELPPLKFNINADEFKPRKSEKPIIEELRPENQRINGKYENKNSIISINLDFNNNNFTLFTDLFLLDILHDYFKSIDNNHEVIISNNKLDFLCKILAVGIYSHNNDDRLSYNDIKSTILNSIKITLYKINNNIAITDNYINHDQYRYMYNNDIHIRNFENNVLRYYKGEYDIKTDIPDVDYYKLSADTCHIPSQKDIDEGKDRLLETPCKNYNEYNDVRKIVTLATKLDPGFNITHVDYKYWQWKRIDYVLIDVNFILKYNNIQICDILYENNTENNRENNAENNTGNIYFRKQKYRRMTRADRTLLYRMKIKNRMNKVYENLQDRSIDYRIIDEQIIDLYHRLMNRFFGDFGQILYSKALTHLNIIPCIKNNPCSINILTNDRMMTLISVLIGNHSVFTSNFINGIKTYTIASPLLNYDFSPSYTIRINEKFDN